MSAGLRQLIASQIAHHADRVAIVAEDESPPRSVTYAALGTMVERLRGQLRDLGVAPGQILPLLTRRTPEAVALSLAVVLEGAAFTWINNRYTPALRAYVLSNLAPVGLVVDEEGAELLAGSTDEELATLRPITLHEASPTPSPARGRLTARLLCPVLDPGPSFRGPGEVRTGADCSQGAACVLFTSGSTGKPKGVLISGDALVACAQTEARMFGLTPDDRILAILPLSFDVALFQLFATLSAGAALHLSSAWLRNSLQSVIQRAGITGLAALPGVWTIAMRHAGSEDRLFGTTPKLRYVTVSGGSLPAATFSKLTNALDEHVAIHKTYGQTETFRSSMFVDANHAGDARLKSVGRALPGVTLAIAKDRDTLAVPNELGELLHIGDGTMIGYLNDATLTASKLGAHAAFPGKVVVYTGDLGTIDEHGYLFLTGRADSLIKCGGYRLYPREVEEVLATHASVLEVVVFGVFDPVIGDSRLGAVVLLRQDGSVEAVEEFARHALPGYLQPRIVAWAELPRTSNGKPLLEEIKARYVMELDAAAVTH